VIGIDDDNLDDGVAKLVELVEILSTRDGVGRLADFLVVTDGCFSLCLVVTTSILFPCSKEDLKSRNVGLDVVGLGEEA